MHCHLESLGSVIPPKQNSAGDYQRVDEALRLTADTPPRPRRLGHMLLFSSDIDRSQTFYERTLGLCLSDKIPGAAVFMNAGAGDHHVFGFVQSGHPGLHSSREVGNLDFHHMRDPWGSWIEYFIDMDQITENWQAREWGWGDASPSGTTLRGTAAEFQSLLRQGPDDQGRGPAAQDDTSVAALCACLF